MDTSPAAGGARLGRPAHRLQHRPRDVPRPGAALLREAHRAAPPAMGARRHRPARACGWRPARPGLLCPMLAEEYRRRRRRLRLQRHHHRGDRPDQCTGPGFPLHSDIVGALHRDLATPAAEARMAAEDGARRDHRRHRHDRAGHGQRPEGDAHHGAARGRPLRHQRREDLHQQRPERRPGHRLRQDRPGGGAQGHQPDLRRGGHAGLHQGRATWRRSACTRRTPPSCSSRMCGCRSRTCWARRTRASPT